MCHVFRCFYVEHIDRVVFAWPKESVASEYYGGKHDPASINTEFTKPIELVHMTELEEDSLAVVREWEKSLWT